MLHPTNRTDTCSSVQTHTSLYKLGSTQRPTHTKDVSRNCSTANIALVKHRQECLPLAAPKEGAVLAAAAAPPKEKLLLLLPAKQAANHISAKSLPMHMHCLQSFHAQHSSVLDTQQGLQYKLHTAKHPKAMFSRQHSRLVLESKRLSPFPSPNPGP